MIGEVLGSYRILSQLGAGGMGAVYLAEHKHLGRKAAIKVLLKEFVSRPDLLDRFFSEARATSMIEDPGIVRIFDCEVDPQGRPYIVMEYIPGESLSTALKRQRVLPWADATAYIRRMAEALATAHDKGIIHRDIKPDNVFVSAGPPAAIKFVDFGIAKLADEFHADKRNRTQTGMVMGTPLYMSPEQCRGAGKVDYRTDIYSLGCVYFEMLTGRPPFQHEGPGELVVAHLTQAPPHARELNPAIPAEVNTIVASMLAKPPSDRPQTMRQVAELLGRLVGTGSAIPAVMPPSGSAPAVRSATPAAPPPTVPPPTSTAGMAALAQTTLSDSAVERPGDASQIVVPRRRGGLVIAGLLLAAGAGGALLLARGGGDSARPPPSVPPAVVTSDPVVTPPPAPAPSPAVVSAPPAVVSAPPATATPAPSRTSAATVTDRPAARPVPRAPGRTHVLLHITSDPPGAEICGSDRAYLGVTGLPLQLPTDGRSINLQIYLYGHKLEKIRLRGDRDTTRLVKMSPLGIDDWVPTPCLR